MRVLSLAAAVCLVSFSLFTAQAQRTGTATLAGRVLDPGAAPVPGARVSITGPGLVADRTVTGPDGRFAFDRLSPGTYFLEVTHAGFSPATRSVAVPADGRSPAPVTLTLTPVRTQARTDGAAADARAVAQPAESVIGASKEAGMLIAAPAGPPPAALSPGVAYGRPTPRAPFNTEAYDRIDDNRFRAASVDPLSTFSIDVDTASYANVRRFLGTGTLPPPDAVRIEELINYFRFDYPEPEPGQPFSVTTELAAAPWNPRHRLALVGLRARPVPRTETLRRNLVFLIDVSGSMTSADKLPLVRQAMRLLVDTLTARDRVAIVVYAGASGLVLPSTPGDQRDSIHRALERLEAGGSTNGAAGITLAYQVAQEHFVRGGINRVILATDGDFNVGVTSQGDLLRLIEGRRDAGVSLSVLGVGTGNLKDSTMEKLADTGNGNYSYLDSLHEARKVLVAEAGGTLVTVAKDVKIQVEFNPAHVAAYRLIGYENRVLAHEAFNDDRRDAGDIGAGHTVTALYEIVPPGVPMTLPSVDPLKYSARPPAETARPDTRDEMMTVKLRFKEPDGTTSRLVAHPVKARVAAIPSANLGFAAAVAEFGMLLRRSEHRGSATYEGVVSLARQHRGVDEHGYRAEFIRLVELAAALDGGVAREEGHEGGR